MLDRSSFIEYAGQFRYVNTRCREWTEAMKNNSIGEYTHGDAMTPDALLGVGSFLLGYATCEYPHEVTFKLVEQCIGMNTKSYDGINEFYDKIVASSSMELSNAYFTQPKSKMFGIVLDSMREITQGDVLTGELFEDLGLVGYAPNYKCMSYLLSDCAELLCYAFDISIRHRDTIIEFCTKVDGGSSEMLYDKLKF